MFKKKKKTTFVSLPPSLSLSIPECDRISQTLLSVLLWSLPSSSTHTCFFFPFLFAASSISSLPHNSLPMQRWRSKSLLLLLLSIILMWIMRSQERNGKIKVPWWVEIWERWWALSHGWLVYIACLMNKFRPRSPFAFRFVENSFTCHLGKPWTQFLKQNQQTKPLFNQLYKLNSLILSQENHLERVTCHSPMALGICSLPSKVFLEYKQWKVVSLWPEELPAT